MIYGFVMCCCERLSRVILSSCKDLKYVISSAYREWYVIVNYVAL